MKLQKKENGVMSEPKMIKAKGDGVSIQLPSGKERGKKSSVSMD